MSKRFSEYLDDPTTTGTFLGFLFLALQMLTGQPPNWVVGLPWALVGVGGIGIMLYMHVYEQHRTWGWQSLWSYPTKDTTLGILGHLPQAIVGMTLIVGWI